MSTRAPSVDLRSDEARRFVFSPTSQRRAGGRFKWFDDGTVGSKPGGHPMTKNVRTGRVTVAAKRAAVSHAFSQKAVKVVRIPREQRSFQRKSG